MGNSQTRRSRKSLQASYIMCFLCNSLPTFNYGIAHLPLLTNQSSSLNQGIAHLPLLINCTSTSPRLNQTSNRIGGGRGGGRGAGPQCLRSIMIMIMMVTGHTRADRPNRTWSGRPAARTRGGRGRASDPGRPGDPSPSRPRQATWPPPGIC